MKRRDEVLVGVFLLAAVAIGLLNTATGNGAVAIGVRVRSQALLVLLIPSSAKRTMAVATGPVAREKTDIQLTKVRLERGNMRPQDEGRPDYHPTA